MGGEHPSLHTVQLDRRHLFAERGDPLPGGGNTTATPPAREIVVRGRTVRRQETARDGGQRSLRIDRRRYRGQPGVRTREPDALTQAGPEAQAACERGRLQDGAPTALRELGAERGRPGETSHLLHQLFARHYATVKRGCDGFRQAVEFLDGNPEIFLPQCGLQIPPTRAEGGVPQG